MLYLSGAVRPELSRLGIGLMLTPSMGNRPDLTGVAWAADTGCFADPASYSDARYLAFLARLSLWRGGCLFATAPDVVGDWAATWGRSRPVLPLIRGAGYRAALVAQDGMEDLLAPDEWDVLFVGGTTGWKLSETAYRLVREAKALGKGAHLGRVNSLRRLRAAQWAGYDSADGTFLKYGPDKNLPRLCGWLDSLKSRPGLPLW